MAKNIITVKVTFNSVLSKRFMTTPTFMRAFDMIPEFKSGTAIAGTEYTFNANHTHKGFLQRMASSMPFVSAITFSN